MVLHRCLVFWRIFEVHVRLKSMTQLAIQCLSLFDPLWNPQTMQNQTLCWSSLQPSVPAKKVANHPYILNTEIWTQGTPNNVKKDLADEVSDAYRYHRGYNLRMSL